MRWKLLSDREPKSYAVVFETGDDVPSGLLEFAKQQDLSASHFTAIGAFSRVTLGYFELAKKEYKHIPLEEQVEVLSLVGNIALRDGEQALHAHVVVGRFDGTTRGGHLIAAQVRPTLEVMLTETSAQLHREVDPATGLPLLDL